MNKGNNKWPLVSVIIPVYNTECFFERCITSVLSQSYKNIEIIVVNDGSSGNIRELMSRYVDEERVHFIDRDINQGLLRTRVEGVCEAKGDYVAFVDSDDYLSFDFFRTLVVRALETDADIVVGKTVWDEQGYKYVYNHHDNCFHFDVMEGEQIRDAYFGQEAQCYSWHTIWNKIYKRTLWDKCQSEFKSVKEHIVMTEDIYFSSLLFCQAEKIACVENDAYFYCINEYASTNSNQITYEKFKKNLTDITYVFDKVEEYLKKVDAKAKIIQYFQNARAHYARMWKHLAKSSFKNNELEGALELVTLLSVEDESKQINDYFFESVKTEWGGGLEYIKEQLANADAEYISFDIFDTLITRPFYKPADLFQLINSDFSEKLGNNILFSKLRMDGEKLARKFYGEKYQFEDISIDEIYNYIELHYRLPHAIIGQMLDLEKHLEIAFASVRRAGKELFELALNCGKHVVLVTDMYLDRDTIERLLKKNDIYGYEKLYISCEERKLKYNGSLFEDVLLDTGQKPENFIHVGDTWSADVEGSKKAGIDSIFFPKAIEIFENKIQNIETNRCSDIGSTVCGERLNYGLVEQNIAFRCMKALVANKYFDNPYRTFHDKSDFNADPFFIGYYLIGMHMMAINKWIRNEVEGKEKRRILFLARDGYLPMKTFSLYAKYCGLNMDIEYRQASRKALMPMIIKDKINFYQAPIEYRGHSPATLMEVFSFAVNENEMHEPWETLLKRNGMNVNKNFESLEELHHFIEFFLNNIYSVSAHIKSKELVKRYYSDLQSEDVLFDMGYTGRIQSAICEAVGFPVDALFVHEDYDTSVHMRKYSKFKINALYDFRPTITGLMREHIFSDMEGSCISFEDNGDAVVHLLGQEKKGYPDKYVVTCLQEGAYAFVKRYLEIFEKYEHVMDYSSEEVSLPFEGFLRYASDMDMHIFSESYFEDIVYGACKQINIEEFVRQQMNNLRLPQIQASEAENDNDVSYMTLIDILNGSSKFKRAIMWMLLDSDKFKLKLKTNIKSFWNLIRGKRN